MNTKASPSPDARDMREGSQREKSMQLKNVGESSTRDFDIFLENRKWVIA